MNTPDLFLPASLLVSGLIFVLPVFLIWLCMNPNKGRVHGSTGNLPPGKLGWPIVGETLALASSCHGGSFFKFISDRMNRYSPQVFKTSLFGEKMAVFCGPSGNKFVFSNENKLVSSWWPSSVAKLTGSASRSPSEMSRDIHRRVLPEILKPDALHGYVPIIHTLVQQHLETEWSSSEIKAHPLIGKLVFSLACSLFIGMDDHEWVNNLSAHFSDVMAGIFSLPIDFPGMPLRHGIKAANAIRDMLYPIINLRRNQILEGKIPVKKDLLSKLLTAIADAGKEFSAVAADHEIADGIFGILIASHDTTISILTSLVSYLADYPDIYDRVFQEQTEVANTKGQKTLLQWEDIKKMKYSRNVIHEVMRIAPAAQGTFREAITDFTYQGYTIPKGWKIFWSVQTTHKNPKYFPNPEMFDPSRFEGNGHIPFTFVPFGGGPRMCPGADFARLEILIILHCLVTKFRWTKLIPNEKIICKVTPYPAEGLPIQLVPHENQTQLRGHMD